MVMFSCFSLHHFNRSSKKAVQQHPAQIFPGKMQKEVPELPQDSGSKESPNSACSYWNTDGVLSTSTPEQTDALTFNCGKSENFSTIPCVQGDEEINQTSCLKKSQSLGSGLDRGCFSCKDLEGELDDQFLFVDPNEDNNEMPDSINKCGSVDSFEHHGTEMKYYKQNHGVHSPEEKFHVHHESFFSIGDSKLGDPELHDDIFEQYSAAHADTTNFTGAAPSISRQHSLPSLCAPSLSFLSSCECPRRARSFEDLGTLEKGDRFSQVLGGFQKQVGALADYRHVTLSSILAENKSSCQADAFEDYIGFNYPSCSGEILDQERDAVSAHEINVSDVRFTDEYDSNNINNMNDYSESQKIGTDTSDAGPEEHHHAQKYDEMTGQEFNMRRVEDWLSQIDFSDEIHSEEIIEVHSSVSVAKMKDTVHSIAVLKVDTGGNPGMEAAYNYISSLTAVSTSAQMAGLGLVAIPFLSTFTSLRLLNLSGNSIVRITAGALPRGLHMLNLSKNNISVIEGFRDLTRLRVLDLSYNRLLRIGHGLSACASLKELYLAGNKISEIEGLHRLLKLSILDLRYNKISTTKCLGQLAANYASLQAINLDGNPAQRNVGDEQLRKFVVSLLPHLVYFNKHIIKSSSSKEVSDRSSRSGTSHQFDRSLRSDQKRPRRGHHASTSLKHSTSSNHGKSIQATSSLMRQSRTPHAPLPPLGSKPGYHMPIVVPKLLSLQLSSPIRRSRSEGNLG